MFGVDTMSAEESSGKVGVLRDDGVYRLGCQSFPFFLIHFFLFSLLAFPGIPSSYLTAGWKVRKE